MNAEPLPGIESRRRPPSPTGAPPIYPVKFIMPFGGLLLVLQGVVWLIRDIYFVATGRKLK